MATRPVIGPAVVVAAPALNSDKPLTSAVTNGISRNSLSVDPDRLLTCQQAADFLNVSVKTLNRMIARKEISYVELSRHNTRRTIRFERAAIDVFVARRRLKAVA
jgi:excisionase family DNA binding protein